MKARLTVKISILLFASLFTATHAQEIFAQQRPGIRPFVSTPEGCYLTEPADPESLYSFTKIQVQALWLAARGEEADSEVLTAGEDLPMNKLAMMIAGLRQERIENVCAAFVLSGFTGSTNEGVASTAKLLVLSYQELDDMTNEMLRIVMQGSMQKNEASTRDRLSQWRSKRREILSSMVEAANFSLSLLVDRGRKGPDGNPDHMILTRAERNALLDYLKSTFPSLEKEKKVAHSGDFIEQAILIQSFLTSKYKPADN